MPLNRLKAAVVKKFGYHRRPIKLTLLWFIDLALVLITMPLALFVRMDFNLSSSYLDVILKNYCLIGAICYGFAFLFFRTYSTLIRLANLNTALRICAASFTGMVIFYTATNLILQLAPIPRSVFLIQLLLFIPLATIPRFSFRIMEKIVKLFDSGVPTLIYGAGRTTNIFLPVLLKPASGIKVIGLIDDDRNKRRGEIQGVSILGTGQDLEYLVEKYSVQQVIISMPQLDGVALRSLISRLRLLGVAVKRVPDASESINAQKVPDHVDLRDIDIEDLLQRPSRRVDPKEIKSLIEGQIVLVTGGGGSIGSELCRQIISMMPKKLIINDSCEYNLYSICEELWASYPNQKIIPSLVDLSHKNTCAEIFASHPIDIVFHAAAYKHVHLVEDNVISAIRNNIGCTLNLFDVCWQHKIKRVIFISSDKAVRPTNVMGASKRLCELIGLWYAQNHQGTIFSAVRFGNVLGSSGSVIPKFLKQIKKGGPVTITHPDITRYFMLIPEAVSLVLQAAKSSNSGDLYVLDMGEPIKILDLARDLIEITGLKEGIDINIEFTGLRKGEKMHEELHLDSEQLERVSTDYHRVATRTIIKNRFTSQINDLMSCLQVGQKPVARSLLFSIIEEYEQVTDSEPTVAAISDSTKSYVAADNPGFPPSPIAEVGI